MTLSYTTTGTTAFTVIHARYLAAKVAPDLKRVQRFYGKPDDDDIDAFEQEIVELLKHGYLGTVTYGFRRNGNLIEPTLRYTAQDLLGGMAEDHDPGHIKSDADISGASFYSYLTYSAAWDRLSWAEREDFERNLPFQRTGAPEPGIDGYFFDDRNYSAGGWALNRASVRSF